MLLFPCRQNPVIKEELMSSSACMAALFVVACSQLAQTALSVCAFQRKNRRRVISASADHSIRVWDMATAACTAMLAGHATYVRTIALSGDGLCLFSGRDGHVNGICTAALVAKMLMQDPGQLQFS